MFSIAGSARAVGAAALLLTGLGACGDSRTEIRCTQADAERPAPSTMPTPQRVDKDRWVNGTRLEALPPGYVPKASAEQAWTQLHAVEPATGGGQHELILGLFTGPGFARVPAWALFTSGRAELLDPLPPQPDVTPNPRPSPCVFVDVLTVFNPETGQRFFGSTATGKT